VMIELGDFRGFGEAKQGKSQCPGNSKEDNYRMPLRPFAKNKKYG